MIRASVILVGAGTPAILAKWLEPYLAVPILVVLTPVILWLWDQYPDRRRVAPQLEEDELERSRRARKGGA